MNEIMSKIVAASTTPSAPTLLIVDDSSVDRVTFRRFLTRNNDSPYHILEADSGETGLSILEQASVDLILLDYTLPDTDGVEFLQTLHNLQRPAAPVLMLTGQGNEQVAVQAMKAGAYDYITKQQLTAETLKLTVRTALRESALQAQLAVSQAQQSLIQDIALRMRQSLNLPEILEQAVLEIRQLLLCDRVIIYRFLPDYVGVVEVESVGEKWPSLLNEVIADNCLKNKWVEHYLAGQTTAIANIHTHPINPCHRKMLARYQVQANLVVPLIITADSTVEPAPLATAVAEKTLWGLIIAHQCDAPRQWKSSETQLLEQLSIQLAIAIQQARLYSQLQLANQQLESKVQARTTELEEANAGLLHLNEALQSSNQDLEQFAYIASHDLREPLRKVKSFAELLAKRYEDSLDETGDRYIGYITGGAVRMQTLINDLLSYSRLGKQSLIRTRCDLNAVLQQAIETLSTPITQKQAVIQAESLPTLPVDALQIEQLLTNLIENALKYSDKAAPHITITAEPQGSDWIISVQDNGIGIEEQFFDRIFTIFQRLHSKSEYSGTGIGLAICKKIAERHGGRIGVTSTLNEGSTFWVALPAQ